MQKEIMLCEEKNKHVFRNFYMSGTLIIDTLQNKKRKRNKRNEGEHYTKILVSQILFYDFPK